MKSLPVYVKPIAERERSMPSKAQFVSAAGIYYKRTNGRWFYYADAWRLASGRVVARSNG